MGTNYYFYENDMQEESDALHIGKSSAGWCFSLRIHPNLGIHDLPDWIKKFNEPNTRIKDEYDEITSVEEMLQIITNRSWDNKRVPIPYMDWTEFHKDNHSQSGPKGLIRAKIDGFCIGHGEGTWDLIIREFS